MLRAATLAALAALSLPAAAAASQLIDRNASAISLGVDGKGRALVTYRAHGAARHVLAWGATGAVPPARGRAQVRFRLDYAGGWGAFRKRVWRRFANACRPYDGPPLAWLVAACRAPDGSYWALQSWQRMLPNYGGAHAPWELHLSHWRGPLPVLRIGLDWSYRRFDHLYGRLTYRGRGVFGFGSTRRGQPLDGFGRNVYLDTLDSAYGPGWRRENSFITHTGTGTFCYGFYPHGRHPVGRGTRYRATAIGPGVTPLVAWQGSAPGPYDRRLDLLANRAVRSLGDRRCRPN